MGWHSLNRVEDVPRSFIGAHTNLWLPAWEVEAHPPQREDNGMNEDGVTPRILAVVPDMRAGVVDPTMTRKVVATGPIALAFALFASYDRFDGPGFSVAAQLAPAWVWGVLFLIPGVLMLAFAFGRKRHIFWVAVFAGLLFSFWTITLFLACLKTSAPFTGVGIYGWATLCMAASAARDSDRVVAWWQRRRDKKRLRG